MIHLEWRHKHGRICLRASGPSISKLLEFSRSAFGARLVVLPAEQLAHRSRGLPGTAGAFTADGDGVLFTPRFPFVPGKEYAFILQTPTPSEGGSADASQDQAIIRSPPDASESLALVAEIYPTSPELPRNHLRFYVQFTAPMSEGFASEAVHLRRSETDELIPGAVLLSYHELWDRERRRLTVLLDPGRIKRGLVPNAEVGYPIEAGSSIALTVDGTFRDAYGQPLAAVARREYSVGPDERRHVNPDDWRLQLPAAGSTQPLIVEFDRPLDHALLSRCLTVIETSGEPVAGGIAVAAGEGQASFTPMLAWRAGSYLLRVESRLEDLAGNSVARVFDRDLSQVQDDPRPNDAVAVQFWCR
ncbi:hypothetical protein ACSMXN_14315 [Jatrophihabitans sp. DSM 45814]